jgi:hypothetical protein
MTGTRGFVVPAGGRKTFRLTSTSMSPQGGTFLFVQIRKFALLRHGGTHRGAGMSAKERDRLKVLHVHATLT